MSYEIRLVDPVSGETLELDAPLSIDISNAPERLWAEPNTQIPASFGLWAAVSVKPDPGTHLVEYVRADLVTMARATALEECEMTGPSIRECAEVATRAYLRRHGIEPGQRPSGADPQLTYQSDMIDDEVGNITIDRPGELAEILCDALPQGIAELVAEATQRREYWANTEQARRWRADVEYIVRSHLELEAGL